MSDYLSDRGRPYIEGTNRYKRLFQTSSTHGVESIDSFLADLPKRREAPKKIATVRRKPTVKLATVPTDGWGDFEFPPPPPTWGERLQVDMLEVMSRKRMRVRMAHRRWQDWIAA